MARIDGLILQRDQRSPEISPLQLQHCSTTLHPALHRLLLNIHAAGAGGVRAVCAMFGLIINPPTQRTQLQPGGGRMGGDVT